MVLHPEASPPILTLAIDTCGEFGGIALVRGAVVIEELPLQEPSGFSAVLFDRIRELLTRHGVELPQIGLFAASSGPGGFTGVRIGLAAMKGLGEVLGKPVAAVSSLAALAETGSHPLRATVIDARRGEVFGALYEDGGARIPECVLPFPKLLDLLASRTAGEAFEWVSADPEVFADAIRGTPFERFPSTRAPRSLASAVAKVALRQVASGQSMDPALTEANYVRRSDAELLWKG